MNYMFHAIRFLFVVLILFSCRGNLDREKAVNSSDNSVNSSADLGRNNDLEVGKRLDQQCGFVNPDTSVWKFKLRNLDSALSLFKPSDYVDSNNCYHFYSTNGKELLTLTQHPGDAKFQVSIFRVEEVLEGGYPFRKLGVASFATEKGIRLGLSKSEIVDKLGNCYVSKDSSSEGVILYYRIESPSDSVSGLLRRSNMPVYYAAYKVIGGVLREFEFGYEYP